MPRPRIAQLPAGAGTVGTRIDIRHLAATPVGMRATIRATLREVDGRRFVFDIERLADFERGREIADSVGGQQARNLIRCKARMTTHATIPCATARLAIATQRD